MMMGDEERFQVMSWDAEARIKSRYLVVNVWTWLVDFRSRSARLLHFTNKTKKREKNRKKLCSTGRRCGLHWNGLLWTSGKRSVRDGRSFHSAHVLSENRWFYCLIHLNLIINFNWFKINWSNIINQLIFKHSELI